MSESNPFSEIEAEFKVSAVNPLYQNINLPSTASVGTQTRVVISPKILANTHAGKKKAMREWMELSLLERAKIENREKRKRIRSERRLRNQGVCEDIPVIEETGLVNSIVDLSMANAYLQKYSLQSRLDEEIGKNGETRYRFSNVPLMRNYKSSFQSVAKAMNCLFAHENGWIRKRF